MKKIILLNIGLILFSALHAQEKIVFGVVSDRKTTATRTADSMRKLLVPADTIGKKPVPKKPITQLPKKPAEAIEVKRKQ